MEAEGRLMTPTLSCFAYLATRQPRDGIRGSIGSATAIPHVASRCFTIGNPNS